MRLPFLFASAMLASNNCGEIVQNLGGGSGGSTGHPMSSSAGTTSSTSSAGTTSSTGTTSGTSSTSTSSTGGPAPSCTDGIKDGEETDVDCGGESCPPCATGQLCLVSADCFSDTCLADVCRAPTCIDGVKNGNETGVDCGGPVCPECHVGQGCVVDTDCTSGTCVAGICH